MNQNHASFEVRLNRKQIFYFLCALAGFALLFRLMIAYLTVHYFDISYYVDWSTGAAWDFFGAYENIKNLDYPPLFLFPLFITGKLIGNEAVSSFDPHMMLALKGWQILFDVAVIPLLYVVLRRMGGVVCGLAGAALWAVNPAMILDSSYWGQTDSMMVFLLVLAFYLLSGNRPVASGVVMALACLMKFQSLYFAPLFALALLASYRPKQIFKTIGAGAVTVAAVFLPFMIRSGWKLPFEVYFGGYGRYKSASLNAFNFYSAVGLNYKSADLPVFGLISANALSMVFMALAFAMLIYFYFTAREKSVWLLGMLFMQTIFIFTVRMHERYQIPAMVFAGIACVCHRSKPLFLSFVGLTVMIFFNQFFMIEELFSSDKTVAWIAHYDQIARVFGFLNVILYAVTLVVAIRIFYRHGRDPFFASLRAAFAGKPGKAA